MAVESPYQNYKVLMLVHEELYGGGTRQAFYILKGLVEQGISTVLASNAKDTWLGTQIKEHNLPITTYYTPLIQRAISPYKELLLLPKLVRILKTEKPHVVVASGVKLIGHSGLAGWLAGVPKRVAIIRGEGAPPGSRMLKAIYTLNRFVGGLGTHFITVSEYIRQQMMAHNIASPEKITTVYDGVDIERFEALPPKGTLRERFGISEEACCIGMVGRLVSGKRYDLFLTMMKALCDRFPHVVGLMIGEGPDRPVLENAIQTLGMENRVFITGFINPIQTAYADMDISVLFTDFEGCPNAVLESFAAGIPVIASSVCGIPELIQHGQTGFLTENTTIQQAIDAAVLLIQQPETARSIAEHAKARVKQHFEEKAQVNQIISACLAD
jgi:glycosyltransferase involved in cell wall biosynthesis